MLGTGIESPLHRLNWPVSHLKVSNMGVMLLNHLGTLTRFELELWIRGHCYNTKSTQAKVLFEIGTLPGILTFV